MAFIHQKVASFLELLNGMGYHPTYTVTAKVDTYGGVSGKFVLTCPNVPQVETEELDEDMLLRHVEKFQTRCQLVVKLLGQEITIPLSTVMDLKKDLSEQLKLDLEFKNIRFVENEDLPDHGYVYFGKGRQFSAHTLDVKSLATLYRKLQPVENAYPALTFTGKGCDELAAALQAS